MTRAFVISIGMHLLALMLVFALGFLPSPIPRLKINLDDILNAGGGGGTPGLPLGPAPAAAPPKPKPKTIAVALTDPLETINGLKVIRRPAKATPEETPKPVVVKTPEPEKTPVPKTLKSETAKKIVKTKNKAIVDKAPTPQPTPKDKEIAAATPEPKTTPPKQVEPSSEIDIESIAAPTAPVELPDSVIAANATGAGNSSQSSFGTVGGVPGGPAGGGGTGGPGPGGTGGGYGGMVIYMLQQNFHPPYTMPGAACQVGFNILRDGTLTDWRIVRSCGRPDLDQSAIRAITDTGKVAPLYDGYPKQHMEAEVTFLFEKN